MEKSKINVALLLGGTSPEKEVSRKTAKSILIGLRKLGYNVRPIDPGLGINQPEDENKLFESQDESKLSQENYITTINSKLFDDIDVAFLALHGKPGEDGAIHSLLELRGIKYTGSNMLTSALAMDKALTKVVIKYHGVQTPEWVVVEKGYNNYDEIEYEVIKNLDFPCVVKPNDQGSTVGLSICKNKEDLKKSIDLALEFSEKALLEKYIPGREFTVAVLENIALPVLEIRPKSGFYDYESKYTSGMSEYLVPAPIPAEVTHHLQQQAIIAFKAVGCKTYSRIDFRLTEDYESYCLEINTLPGMTSLSLVPKAANAAGISFEELIERILISALK